MKMPLLLVSLIVAAMPLHAEDDIAANERQAMSDCISFSQAQEIFRRTDYDRDGVLEFAQSLMGGKPAVPKGTPKTVFPQPNEQERAQIAELIQALGAPDYSARENAMMSLAQRGAKACAQLLDAQNTLRDAEVVFRSKLLLQQIQATLSPDSSPQKRCGLFRIVANNGAEHDISLLDRAIAEAECPIGTDPASVAAYKGYVFRILLQQGDAALGGARNYVVNGNMNLGYALLAFPQEYGKTGKKCFMISNQRAVVSRDFGDREKTDAFSKQCVEYNPALNDATGNVLWGTE